MIFRKNGLPEPVKEFPVKDSLLEKLPNIWWDCMINGDFDLGCYIRDRIIGKGAVIINYSVDGWILKYNVSYPRYLNYPRYTIQHKVDLRTGKEIEIKQLKRYDVKGEANRY